MPKRFLSTIGPKSLLLLVEDAMKKDGLSCHSKYLIVTKRSLRVVELLLRLYYKDFYFLLPCHILM